MLSVPVDTAAAIPTTHSNSKVADVRKARRGKCNIMGQGHPSPGAALDCAKYASATQISARRSSKRSKLYTFATTQMRKTQIECIGPNKASARA